MDPRTAAELLAQLADLGLPPEREAELRRELERGGEHGLPEAPPEPDYTPGVTVIPRVWQCPYVYHDLTFIQAMSMPPGSYTARIGSLDELMERDSQREKDGFPRKIRIGRLVKPGRGGRDKVIVVPTTVEDKFVHDNKFKEEAEGSGAGGSGDGEEGEVIGEQPVRPQQGEGEGAGPGQGESGPHEVESNGTTVIDAGWSGSVNEYGHLLLELSG
ncbi:MAG: hypothetical protein JRE71_18460, partial [Deltaproteobacteria bacterium]|nr:hypothetical protein [Deltaproteobacteria bacterium]